MPEQHTDYIFSTVGEEWGFLGASSIIILFTFLMLRISKRQNYKEIYLVKYILIQLLL